MLVTLKMASHVAITQSSGTDKSQQEAAGPSYAHAVRFKPADNKENINNDEVNQVSHSPNKAKQMDSMEQSTVDDNDGTFTPVVGHSRRDRKNERSRREKVREIKVVVNGQVKDDNKEKPKDHSNRDTKTGTEKLETPNFEKTELVMEKKVFVEAPIPKVNPWQINKNAAQVVNNKDNPGHSNSNGKRVLQPQKQDAAVNGQSSSVVRAKDKRKYNHKASDFTYVCDWPILGDHSTERKANNASPVPNPQQGNSKQSSSNDDHEDSESERRKKNSKHKWVPLDIDLNKGNKRDSSPKQRSDAQSTVSEGDKDTRSESNNTNHNVGKHTRPSSAAPRGRGRNRGGRRAGYNRPANRIPSEPEYSDYSQDFMQLSKFGVNMDVVNFTPYMGTFYFNSNSYVNLDSPTLKGHIKNQIEYYFSEENLLRDFFLRRKMDADGYLPVTLIASFHRIQSLTNNISLILEAINNSDKLELASGFKVRTRHDPKRWPILEKNGDDDKPMTFEHLVPPPPLPKNFRDPHNDNLNPDVAEFIPHDMEIKNNTKKEERNLKANVIEEKKNVDDDNWKEVKRKTKEAKVKKESKEKEKFEREELEFHFDEELDLDVPTGRQNTFTTDWPEDDSDELSDHDVNKLLIVTQSSRVPKHEGYDRTGDWMTRVKMTQDLEQAINDGLYYYEEGLWNADYDRPGSGSYRTVNVISQEAFEKMAPPAPKKQNPEVPPPPPPMVVC
ncbi:hypothetical protein AMK59_6528 [Oryctes borbonicus]|uniref:La-related protein 1 n=1 Tax=Oryctes borbonicus TaxID=1629725 RepID=A0A0T6AUD2_9SCAR|nr:hypothetical protein AMK59_6528 [Oryctes borbonicus]